MIRAALSFVTGGSVTRLAATGLAFAALGATAGWHVQGWRHGNLRAQAVQQQARDQLRQIENRDLASAAYQQREVNAEQQHIKIVERVRLINASPAGAVQCLTDDGLRALSAAIDNGASATGPGIALPATGKAE